MKHLRELERAFIRRFAPAGARSPQDFLHDFDRVVRSWLEVDELERCAEAYGELLRAAATRGPAAVGRVLSASELMLGHLGRAREAGVCLTPGPLTEAISGTIREILRQVDEVPSLCRSQDGFKRIEVILLVLEDSGARP